MMTDFIAAAAALWEVFGKEIADKLEHTTQVGSGAEASAPRNEVRNELVAFLARLPVFGDDNQRQFLLYHAGLDRFIPTFPTNLPAANYVDRLLQTLETAGGSAYLQPLFAAVAEKAHLVGDPLKRFDQFQKAYLAMEELGHHPVKQHWQQFDWQDAGERYLTWLYDEHSHVRPLGSPKPIPLDRVFVDVYIIPEPTDLRRINIDDQQAEDEQHTQNAKTDPTRGRYIDNERIPGLELMRRESSKRLFILGGPGSGKTTFLCHIMIQTIKQGIEQVPIFLSLKRWADSGQELLDYIAQQFEPCGFPDALLFIKHILKKGRTLVLFDGLDEIPQAEGHRKQAIDALQNFARQYNAVPCLITCRRAAEEIIFEQFTYVEMANFNDDQIDAMVEGWFAHDKRKADLFLKDLLLKENKGMHQLARTPLLLALLCLTFEQNLHFPQHRIEIYHDAIDALLRRWDVSRNIRRDELYKGLSPDRKHQMLADVAVRTFIDGIYFIDQERLQELLTDFVRRLPGIDPAEIDGSTLLRAIEAQHGILVERAHRIYSFAHLSFQEYFAAMAIKDWPSEATFTKLFAHFLGDNRWHEVFLLTARALKETSIFFNVFRGAINRFIASDRTLKALAIWADKKAQVVSGPISRNEARRLYWLAALDFDLGRTRAHARARQIAPYLTLARNRVRTRAHPHAQILTISRYLALHLTGACYLLQENVPNRTRYVNSAYRLTHALTLIPYLPSGLDPKSIREIKDDLEDARNMEDYGELKSKLTQLLPTAYKMLTDILGEYSSALDYPVLCDYSLVRFVLDLQQIVGYMREKLNSEMVVAFGAYLTALAKWSQGSCYPGLDAALDRLSVPAADSNRATWDAFVADVKDLQRHIGAVLVWKLSRTQANQVADYFDAVNLLEECLEVASAANREAIRESLLLPPGAWQPDRAEGLFD